MMRYAVRSDGQVERAVELRAWPAGRVGTTISLYERDDAGHRPGNWSNLTLGVRAKGRFGLLLPVFWAAAARAIAITEPPTNHALAVALHGHWTWQDAEHEFVNQLVLRVYEIWPANSAFNGRVLMSVHGRQYFELDEGPLMQTPGDAGQLVGSSSDDPEWQALRRRLSARFGLQANELLTHFAQNPGLVR
jgi:hypothetical protein